MSYNLEKKKKEKETEEMRILTKEIREITEKKLEGEVQMHDNYFFQEKSIHTEDAENKYQELHGAVPEQEPPEEDPELEPTEKSDGAHFQRQEDDEDKYPELDEEVLELKPPEEDPEPEHEQ